MATILFVDDDIQALELMKKQAEMLNQQAYSCSNANQVAALTTQLKPDLILMDINMNDCNGFELVKILRKQPETRKTPILMLSASDATVDGPKASLVGANGFLSKPLNFRELSRAIQQYTIYV